MREVSGYVWGGDKPFLLSRADIPNNRRNISLTKLTQPFHRIKERGSRSAPRVVMEGLIVLSLASIVTRRCRRSRRWIGQNCRGRSWCGGDVVDLGEREANGFQLWG